MAFLYGLAVGVHGVFPYSTLRKVRTIAKSLILDKRIVPEGLFRKAPKDAARKRIKIYDREQMQAGFYIFLVWDDSLGKYAAWLCDEHEDFHHTWPIDYYSMDPDGPLNGSDTPHAFRIMADGSMILNYDYGDIMARLDPCGKPIWTKKGVFHHSLDEAEDGSFWTWRGPGTACGHHNYLVNFDPVTGTTIKEVSLVDDIIKGEGTASIVFGTRRDYNFLHFEKTPDNEKEVDLFHPNDIEVLFSDLAEKFPEFSAGDLLLSFKNINLVAVMDPVSYQLKWWSNGPWRYQHDPDFTDDGKISVYNNNRDRARSEIIKIDPSTMELSNELLNGEGRFYSHSMGQHQYLPNGNVLIVVPQEGRVLVLSRKGNKVFEFNNVIQNLDLINAHVSDGMWVPKDFFDKFPECTGSTH
jgi:hypothetical protein